MSHMLLLHISRASCVPQCGLQVEFLWVGKGIRGRQDKGNEIDGLRAAAQAEGCLLWS